MLYSLTYILVFFIVTITFCEGIGFIATGLTGIAISMGFASWKFLNCNVNECCDKTWVKYNHDSLRENLTSNLFGQHLVEFIVLKSLQAHLQKENPKKALVMAFHGDTGTGKNHVSKMIAQNLFKEGLKSQYVHFYIATRDFPHKQEIDHYRDKLRKEIEEHTSKCKHSLFIFDEVDKMAPGVLDALKPYVDYHDELDGTDYRNNVFIFLSNAGSRNITEIVLKFWSEGKHREDIALKDIEHLITKGAFNEEGGLRHSEIVKRELIDVYVPFLPMEKKHVKLCVQSELKARSLSGDENYIASQLLYIPPEIELFSTSGCKKISQKVDLYGS